MEGAAGSTAVVTRTTSLVFYGEDGIEWVSSLRPVTGGVWLFLNPTVGLGERPFALRAELKGLPRGEYTSEIYFSARAQNSPQRIRVTLRVRDPLPASLRLSASTLAFTATEGKTDPAAQRIQISRVGEANADWAVSAETLNGGPWLSVTPAQGTNNGEISVRAALGTLAAGVYGGKITITSAVAANSPIVLPVSFQVAEPPIQLTESGIVHAATGQRGPIAPGQLISLIGARLGPQRGVASRMDEQTRRFPSQLSGTKVSFDGTAASILYASFDQANIQVPFEVAGKSVTKMKVESLGSLPVEINVPVREAAPGIFSADGVRAIAVNADGSLNDPANPCAGGDIVQIFLTGQGKVEPQLPTGLAGPMQAPYPVPVLPLLVRIGGLEARVLFTGLMPGGLGVLQLNVEAPRALAATEAARVEIRLGAFDSTVVPVIAVKAAPPAP